MDDAPRAEPDDHAGPDKRAGRAPSPGYLWRPGSSPTDNPSQLVVAIVIGLVILGAILAALLT